MSLLVLAYPELTPSDREWVESIRTQYDPRHEDQVVRAIARLALG